MSSSTTFVSGQNLGHAGDDQTAAFADNLIRLQQVTGRWPAILTVDYGFDEIPINQQITTDQQVDQAGDENRTGSTDLRVAGQRAQARR